MRGTLITIIMAVLVSPALFAQAGKWKEKRMTNVKPGTFDKTSHPTRVTGEGRLTPGGVEYWDIQTGQGEPATNGHAVQVRYTAWVENGKEFASSISDGRAPVFTLGVGQVIPGWRRESGG